DMTRNEWEIQAHIRKKPKAGQIKEEGENTSSKLEIDGKIWKWNEKEQRLKEFAPSKTDIGGGGIKDGKKRSDYG
ncbi:hypothetical protein HHI36_003837, partial [Cryptolaemus montrouzieri]